MKNSLRLVVKYPIMGLAIFGLASATLVWAAPKINKLAQPAKKPVAPKTTAPKTTAPVKVIEPAKATPIKNTGAVPKAVAPVAAPVPPATATTVTATDEVAFTPSQYPGVVVRSVPQEAQQRSLVDTSKGPVLYNERPAPGGGMMADVAFPREVETVDNVLPKDRNETNLTVVTGPGEVKPIVGTPGMIIKKAPKVEPAKSVAAPKDTNTAPKDAKPAPKN